MDEQQLQRQYDRVLRLCRFAEINKVYDVGQLATRAIQLFFISPKESSVIAQMALVRLKLELIE